MGLRSRAASCDTLWPVAIAVKKRGFSSVFEGDGDEGKDGVCGRAKTSSKDQVGGAGWAGGRSWKNKEPTRSHVPQSTPIAKPSEIGSRMAIHTLELYTSRNRIEGRSKT